MPSTMIHILTAHEIFPDKGGLFWFGNFAPDHVNEREPKDKIHLRTSTDRLNDLKKLKNSLPDGEFEQGWILHLFADCCWDEEMIPPYRNEHENDTDRNWFLKYREEIGVASFNLFHNLPWSKQVWEQIMSADLRDFAPRLPITSEEAESFRSHVFGRHSASPANSVSLAYPPGLVHRFAKETARKYLKWANNTNLQLN